MFWLLDISPSKMNFLQRSMSDFSLHLFVKLSIFFTLFCLLTAGQCWRMPKFAKNFAEWSPLIHLHSYAFVGFCMSCVAQIRNVISFSLPLFTRLSECCSSRSHLFLFIVFRWVSRHQKFPCVFVDVLGKFFPETFVLPDPAEAFLPKVEKTII